MSRWTFVFQRDGLPVSVRREDGSAETPPPGLVRYIEIAHGAWTTSLATDPMVREEQVREERVREEQVREEQVRDERARDEQVRKVR